MSEQAGPLRLRGHTLLCLQGFRGMGYNAEFARAMTAVHARLSTHPETVIIPIASPDELCAHCPHLQEGCTLKGEGFEPQMARQDFEVLDRLGLAVNQPVTWQEVLDRIALQVSGSDLPAICGGCPWLPLGFCVSGVNALKNAKPT